MYLCTKHLVNKRLYNIKPAKYFYNQKPSHLSLQEMLARAYFLYDIDANHLLCNLEHSVLALVYYKTTTNLLLLSELSILQLPGRHGCGWCSLEKRENDRQGCQLLFFIDFWQNFYGSKVFLTFRGGYSWQHWNHFNESLTGLHI